MNKSSTSTDQWVLKEPNDPKHYFSSPAPGSLRQSHYIAALEKYFGMRGLVFPVTEVCGDVRYEYNFFHVATQTAVKVFDHVVDQELAFYLNHTDTLKTLLIIDARTSCTERCEKCDRFCIKKVPVPVLDTAAEFEAHIYLEDQIYEFNEDAVPPRWELLIPAESRQVAGTDAAINSCLREFHRDAPDQ